MVLHDSPQGVPQDRGGGRALRRNRAAAATPRPNIIVIMADDMGYSDLGCYGSEIRTPNIDSLATGGVRFTHFHNTARCCPSRASLLTGLYPHQAGVGHMVNPRPLPGYRGDLNRNCVTIAEVLRAGGYQTMARQVARHAGHRLQTQLAAAARLRPLLRHHPRRGQLLPAPDAGARQRDDRTPKARTSTSPTPSARTPRLHHDGGAQARALLPVRALHLAALAAARLRKRYRALRAATRGWDALRAERHERMIRMGIVTKVGPHAARREVPAWKDAPDKEWQQRRMEVYAAQIDRMDRNVGTIWTRCAGSGQEENTLILFLADNGGCAEDLAAGQLQLTPSQDRRATAARAAGNVPGLMPGGDDTFQSYGTGWANASNTPFRLYKHWVHEGGISTPLIARWPEGIARHDAITHEPGHLIDLMATCVDVAGAQYPSAAAGSAILPLEGRSLRPPSAASRSGARTPSTGSTKAIAPCGTATGSWCRASRTGGSCTTWRPTAAKCTTSLRRTPRASHA